MGQLVSQSIDNLVGGVSQQAPGLRLPTQCEKQVNCWNSVVSGMSPRPGTKRISEIDLRNNTVFSIDYRRDEREFYKVILANDGQDVLKVYDARTGTRFPVEFGPGVDVQVTANNTRNDDLPDTFREVPYLRPQGNIGYDETFQAIPISDSLLLLNKTFPVKRTFGGQDGAADPTVQTSVRYRIGISRIPVERLGSSYYETHPVDETHNPYISNEDGLPAGYVIEINGNQYQYPQNSSAEDVASKLAKDVEADNPGYELQLTNTVLYVTVPSGAPALDVNDKSRAAYWYSWENCWQQYPGGPEECKVYNRYDQTKVNPLTVSSETVTTSVTVDGRPEHEAIVWIKQADYATDYRVFIDGQEASHKTPEATSTEARDGLRTELIAYELANQINTMTGVVCQTYGNVIHILPDNDFTLDVTDSLGDTATVSFKREISDESDLPGTYVPSGYMVRVRGDLSVVSANGYWLKYDGDGNVWKESTGIGAYEGFDSDTMPMLLNRRQDLSRVSGDNPYGIYFELTKAGWDMRSVGDEDSAPFPKFVSEQNKDSGVIESPSTITSMVIHHNRLLLISKATILASEIGHFFNLFPTTVATTVDSDPFEVTIDTNSPVDIRHAQPLASALVLWDSREQHALKSDAVFTAETVYSTRISSKDVDLSVEPLVLGNRGMFLTNRGKFYGCHELYSSDGVEVFDTSDVSGQIPEYLQGDIIKMVGSTENNLVLFLTNHISDDEEAQQTNSNTVYVYNYYDSGRERVQSAWSTWRFGGQVVDLSIDGTEILLTIEREVEPEDPDTGTPPVYKTFLESIQLSYDETEQRHGHPVYLDSYVVSDEEPMDLHHQEIKKKLDGVWYRGYPLRSVYEFSPFQVRDRNNNAYSTGRLQLKRLNIEYYDTTNFIFEVETLARETRTQSFQGRVLGRLDNLIGKVPVTTGRYSAPIMGRSGAVKVRIRNREIFGFKFQSATWEGFFNQRSKHL